MKKIKNTIKDKVLRYFYLNEDKSQYVNELARQLSADPMNTYRALTSLEEEGILKSEFKGKQRYFSAALESPVYKNYKAIFFKTAGLPKVFEQKLSSVKGLEEAYIFGSYAAGQMKPESDIDILLVGNHSIIEIQKVIVKLQKEIGREINPVNMTRDEMEKKRSENSTFIDQIFKNKVIRIK